MMRKAGTKIVLAAFAAFALLSAAAGHPSAAAAAQEAKLPQVRIVPSAARVEVGETFEVALWLQGYTGDYGDIQGYEVQLDFDPALIKPAAEAGPAALKPSVFQTAASPMTLANRIDAGGKIQISQITTQKGGKLFAGYGKIGTVVFTAIKPGEAKLSQSKSIVIKEGSPGVNIIHTVNAPTVVIAAEGAEPKEIAEQTATVGEAPAKPASSMTAEQALQAFQDYDGMKAMTWALPAIGKFALSKVVQGSHAGYFEPRRSMTRAEFAKVAVVALGLDMKQKPAPSFADTKKTDWHYDYVETAAEYGLVQGSAAGGGRKVFRPNDPITRAEIAAILSRVLREEGFSAGDGAALPFADVRSAHWAKADIAFLYRYELLQGKTADRFAPDDSASRAEVTVLLDRLLTLLAK